MNAEPPERMPADAGIRASINEFDRARPHLSDEPGWSRIARTPADFRDALDDLIESVQFTKTHSSRLTNEAKWSDIDKLTTAWDTRAVEMVERVEKAVAKWERDLKVASQPPAPTSDLVLLEAKLANARTDAAMVLADTPNMDISDRLAEMARGSDPALRHLILATDWPTTFLRSRGDNTATVMWKERKGEVLASVLTDEALEAHQKLAGIPHARKASVALRAAYSYFRHDNPEYFQGNA